MQISRRILYLAACVLFLAGCGFHLRGAVRLPPVMAVTYIQAPNPYSRLVTDLRQALTGNGVKVTGQRPAATGVLNILGESASSRQIVVSASGQIREMELNYTVNFQLQDAKGAVLLRPQTLTLRRSFTFNVADVLGVGAQQDLLQRAMQRDIVQLMLLRLQALVKEGQ